MISALLFALHVVGFLSSIHAVTATRTDQGAIAWVIGLNAMPLLAVPAYWTFGKAKFDGYVRARREANREAREASAELVEAAQRHRVERDRDYGAEGAAERLASLPILAGNRVDLLIDGEATFDSIFRGIEAAEREVLVQFYTIRDDGLGRQLQERLIAKASEGLRVHLLYDEIGSHSLPGDYLRALREAGVQACPFNGREGRRFRFQLNFRNHRKLVVTDGRVAWVGGHNVGDAYLGKDPEFGPWRDTHVRIEGPAALSAQVSFAEDWHWATGEFPDLSWPDAPAAGEGDAEVLLMPTGPADELEAASLMFIQAINAARDRLWMATPYFIPDSAVSAALRLAVLRGVEVRVLVPQKPDHLIVHLASQHYYEKAVAAGIRVARYQEGFLHQKTLLVDDSLAAIGTANFDTRSFLLNFELTALIRDPDFLAQVEEMFVADFERAETVEEGDLAAKPWWFRIAVRFARLAAPIL